MKADRLSQHEREALGRFLRMTPEDVGARAAEFEASHAAAAEVEVASAQDILARRYDEMAERWRELERALVARGLGRVGELDERDQLRWAERLKALSSTFSRPDERAGLKVREEELRPPQEGLSVPGANLQSEDAGYRQYDATRVGRTRDPKWAPQLVRLLRHDPEERVRRAAARALGSVGGEEARTALLEAESDRDSTCDAIATSLGLLGERDAVPKLTAWLDRPGVRANAIEALGRVGDPAAASVLEERLADADGLKGSMLRRALVELGHPDAVEVLRRHPRRNPWARARELRAAERSAARHAARERKEVPPRLERAVLQLRTLALRGVLTAGTFAAAPVMLLDTPIARVLATAGAAALIVGACVVLGRGLRHEALDHLRWRIEDGATRDHVVPVLCTGLRVAVERLMALVLWVGGTVAVEAATGASGIVAGVACGLALTSVIGRLMLARRISRWQREAGRILLVDAARGPERLSRRRVFSLPR